MKTAWFHCFAGTAGDMTMGALVHAGADPVEVMAIVGAVGIGGYRLTFERVQRCGVAATRAVVTVDDLHPHGHRPYADIRRLLDAAALPARLIERSQRVFRLLADVEGQMHGVDPDEVEFHEVGAIDAIVDIVGSCAALEVLGIEQIVCSPITHGMGTVGAAHGALPHPAPATLEMLARRHAPSRGIDDPRELATPTGVALMCALADDFGPMPGMHVAAIGYGAGNADIEGRPNVVQVVVGDSLSTAPSDGQPVRLFETNVDDATGEVIAHAISALLAAGAHDAWATPIVMKKGRPAYTVHALCDPALAGTVGATLVAETGTLGLRGTTLARWPQRRDEAEVIVGGQRIAVKLAAGRVKVEHDDAAAAAAATGRPLREILAEAAQLASALRTS